MVFGFDRILKDCDFKGKIIVDFGCGFGRWGHLIRCDVDKSGTDAYMVGCDIHRAYLEETRKYNPYDDLVVCDVRYVPFRKKALDIAICFETIEHLNKTDALKFLNDLENCTLSEIMISTPHGYFTQDITRDNKYEKHLSGWLPQDFEKRGFQTFKTGMGYDLEKVVHKFRIFGLLQWIIRKRYRDDWGGVMIFATKTLIR